MAPKLQRASTNSECVYNSSAQAATKKPAKQPTASSSLAKSPKALETENKRLVTAVSDVYESDKKLVDAASACAPSPPPAKAEATWQAAAAVLKDSTPAERSSMARQVPRQVLEAAVDLDKGKHNEHASSAANRPHDP